MLIKAFNKLSEDIKKEIRSMEMICKNYDNLSRGIFLDYSLNFNRNMKNTFLAYEGEELISVLSVFAPAENEVEITGFTLPQYRKMGYFKSLLTKAIEELKQFNVQDILFVCENKSNTGKKTIKKLEGQYDFTEYSMRLDKIELQELNSYRISLLKPEVDDLEGLIDLSMRIFNDSYLDAKELIENIFRSKTREQFMAMLDKQVIGIGAINIELGVATIFGFGVDPDFQGKGYGKEFLHLVIDYLYSLGITKVTLEVNSKNDRAYNLYKDSGFVIESAFEYYRKSILQ